MGKRNIELEAVMNNMKREAKIPRRAHREEMRVRDRNRVDF